MYDVNLTKSYFRSQSDINVMDVCIGDVLKETAAQRTGAEALVEITRNGEEGRRWTYDKLFQESVDLAQALASRFEKGSHIVIWAPNIPEWVLMEYAAALAGIVLVTANPALQEKELRYILEQSEAVGLFLVSEFRGNPMKEIAEQAVSSNNLIREVTDMEDYEQLFLNKNENRVLPNVSPKDPAQIQYTSGTTGFPKGAILSHLGLINNAKFYAARCGIEKKSTWINIMQMFHTSGCGMVTLGCLNFGCRMVLVSIFNPKLVLELIESFSADIILSVPTTALAILEEQEVNPRDMSSLKVISCGGGDIAPEMILRAKESFNCNFSTLYGQTEYCPVITQHHLSDNIDDVCMTIGQPLSQTDVSIQSIEDREILPIGDIGEICARGPSTMIAYYGNPEATDETVDKDGWLHTGDLGFMDQRGYVTITGRLKEMIIRGGENHFPAEIENVLREHPAISDVAIVGIPHSKWGEVIAAFVRFNDEPVSAEELKIFCRAQMSPQKTPTLWRRVDEFPMTGSAKIQKFKLRELELTEMTLPLS